MKQLFNWLLVLGLAFVITSCAHVSRDARRKQALDFMDAAKSLISTNQYREALGELLQAEKQDSNNKEIQYLLSSVYFFGFQRYEDAIIHVEKSIKLTKEIYPEAENLYGVILLDQSKAKEAIVHFKRALDNLLYATPYFAEQNMGIAFTQLGNLEEANAHFKRALMLQPELCGAFLPLAKNLRALKKLKEAENTLHNFIKKCENERLQKFLPSSLIASVYDELRAIQSDLKKR